jgi:hypothetical protein
MPAIIKAGIKNMGAIKKIIKKNRMVEKAFKKDVFYCCGW